MRRLLIDDLRSDKDVGAILTMIARDYEFGVRALILQAGSQGLRWDELYLDHDLGLGKSGYDIMCFLEEHHELLPGKIICVSANGSGRERIELVRKKLYGEL